MVNTHNFGKFILMAVVAFFISACSENTHAVEEKQLDVKALTVYKRAQCGCCGEWMKHMNENGFSTEAHDKDDLNEIKQTYGIHPKLQSCHTSVSTEGFVFEGHIPAKFIRKFLEEKPAGAYGLSVPSMPTGSPGMEYENKLRPYKIYLLKKDGSIEVYAEINTLEEQY